MKRFVLLTALLAPVVIAFGIASSMAALSPGMVISADVAAHPAADSYFPSITPSGRHLAFTSRATNLPRGGVASDCALVYVRNLVTGTVRIASRADDGTAVCGSTFSQGAVSISNDGRSVLFTSDDETMPGPAGAAFVRDLDAGRTLVASRDRDGSVLSVGEISDATISGDGRFVAVRAFVDDGHVIFLRVLDAKRTRALTLDTDGNPLPASTIYGPSLSFDGRFMVAPVHPLWNNDPPPGWEWVTDECSPQHSCPLVYDRLAKEFSIGGGESGIDGATSAVISPQGTFVAWGDPGLVVSNLAAGEIVARPDGIDPCCDLTYELYWSGNERYVLAYDSSQKVTRYDVATGRRQRVAGSCDAGGLTRRGRFAAVTCGGPDGVLVYRVGPLR